MVPGEPESNFSGGPEKLDSRSVSYEKLHSGEVVKLDLLSFPIENGSRRA